MGEYLRKCRVCEKEAHSEQDLELFVRDKTSKHGRSNCCLECRRTEYNKYDELNREKRKLGGVSHYEKYGWSKNCERKYGITAEKYNELYNDQNGSCKICGVHQSHLGERLSIDHCHLTNVVRGLLCRHCNLLLGNASDEIGILENAIKYLKETK